MKSGKLSNTNLNGGEPCGALHSYITIGAGEEKTVNYYLGVTKGALSDYENAVQQTKETLTTLRKDGAVEEQFCKCCAW